MRLRTLSVLGVGVVLAASACNPGTSTPAPTAAGPAQSTAAGTPPAGSAGAGKTITIGTELPMSGGEVANGVPTPTA